MDLQKITWSERLVRFMYVCAQEARDFSTIAPSISDIGGHSETNVTYPWAPFDHTIFDIGYADESDDAERKGKTITDPLTIFAALLLRGRAHRGQDFHYTMMVILSRP